MSEFIYQEPFPIECDKTQYRLLTKEYVKIVECDGRRILKVDPKGIELLAREAYTDVSFYLRPAHLEQLRHILEDPEASDNDKFVAYTMLLNQTVAAEGELPTCQDTGTAICIGKKGENVFTGADDAECIARGAYEAYKERNLRYSQVVPFTMTEEKNSGTNLPAQIDLYADKGNEYKFLFITKGGGSANKTFLYQQTKALLNEKSLLEFFRSKLMDLGTSACPPYHLAVCIGGDQLLKWWVTAHLDVGQSAPLLPGIVRLTRLHNTGAAWSSFSGKTGLLAAVTIVLMAAVVYLVVKKIVRHPLGLTSAMLVLGGGAGNMIDRLCRGYVVDMFDLEFMSYPIFNLADIFVVIGVLLGAVYYLWFYDKYDKPKKEPDHDAGADSRN